jgi:small-conductance mechanosensitive channel
VVLLERSLSIGDVITVDKFSGRVVRINTRYTTLRGSDGVETVVPNDMLVSVPLQNFASTDKSLQLVVQVRVDYQADVDLALRLLQDTALDVEQIDRNLKRTPQAFLKQFAAEGIELELTCWLEAPANEKAAVLSALNRAVWQAFQAHQIRLR